MDKKLLAVIKREYMERVRSKWFVIGTLIVPALVVASFLLPAYAASRSKGSADAKDVVILDGTGSGLGQRVVDALTQEPPGGLSLPTDAAPAVNASHPVLRVVDQARLAQAESLATREVVEKAHVGYLVLAPEALQAQTVHYAGRNATSIPDMERLRGAVRQAVMAAQLEAAGARPEMVEAITKTRIQMPAERITEKGRGGSGTTSVMLGFGIAFILYLAIILHGQNVLRSVLEEKTTRVAEVVISSVRPHVLLAGKVLGVGLVGLTQQVVWIVASAYLINKFTPLVMKMGGASALAKSGATSGFLMALTGVGFKTLALLLAFFLVGFVFYAALYAAIGAMVNSEQEAQQAAVPVMFLLVGTFLFVQQVMFEPTSTLAVVLSWLPFSSPIIMPLRMTVLQLSPGMIAGSLAVGVLSCGAVVWLAARIYRVGMLMYGKRPSLRELVKWVRYA
ncbi:MAG TPA: ABC transporter permease [Gemmatimonadaceae bacterium]